MSSSTIPLWGRAWKLTVTSAGSSGEQQEVVSSSAWDPEALRVVFDVVETTLPSPFWFAEISIYNLNKPEIQNFLMNAVWVRLEAGYQSGPSKSSVIWDGPVLQTMFDRESVVDLKVTFNCIVGVPELTYSIVNFSTGPFASQMQIVQRMVSEIGNGYAFSSSDTASQKLQSKQLVRSKTIFGGLLKRLYETAGDNFLQAWVSAKNINISEMYSGQGNASLVYGPPLPAGYSSQPSTGNITRSVLDVPQQTPFGVIFRVLLDPRLVVKVPPILVQLERTVISQAKVQYGQVQTPLDSNLTFVAAQVRHYGDTRGNEWTTEVTGYSRNYAQGLLQGVFLPNSGGANG